MKYHLKKSQFGIKWPFIPEKVKVVIKNKAAYIVHEGVKYNLNGVACNQKIGKNLDPIWKDNYDIEGTKKSLNSVFIYLSEKGAL